MVQIRLVLLVVHHLVHDVLKHDLWVFLVGGGHEVYEDLLGRWVYLGDVFACEFGMLLLKSIARLMLIFRRTLFFIRTLNKCEPRVFLTFPLRFLMHNEYRNLSLLINACHLQHFLLILRDKLCEVRLSYHKLILGYEFWVESCEFFLRDAVSSGQSCSCFF